jgi:hypothetical protein
MSRQSVWPSAPPPSDHLHYLEDCITATENCVNSLTSTLNKFQPGIRDFPRLNRILVNEHVRLSPPLHSLRLPFKCYRTMEVDIIFVLLVEIRGADLIRNS